MQHARPDYQRNIQDIRTLPRNEDGAIAEAGGIPPNEPVFLLRAQDAVAAATVRFWAYKLLQAGGDPETARQAMAQADAMDAWPVKKTPDAPTPAMNAKRALYQED